MVSFLLLAAIVIFSSWFLTKKYFNQTPFSDLVLVWFILFFAQIVLVQLSLGIIGRLYFRNVCLAHLLILLISILPYRKDKLPPLLKPQITFFIKSNLLLYAFATFLCFFLAKTFLNLIYPPISPGSMQGHLAFPAGWIINGNLDNPFQIFGSIPILNPASLETSSFSYYPINAQLFYTWLMMPLKNAFLADAGEAPFYIIGIIAVYAILRKYNLDKQIALLSGFLWALIPNIFKQLKLGSEIDVICAVLLLLVFETLLLLKRDFTIKNSVLFGIAVGLFAGTKIINLVWLAGFTPVICYILYNGIKSGNFTLSKKIYFLMPSVLMVILFGSYIFIKNYIFTGNPLFPVNIRIFGKTIFKGLLNSTEYKMQVASWGLDLKKIIFKEGLGVQFAALILPATFAPFIFIKYLKAKFSPLGEYLLLFAAPLLMLVLYTVSINVYTVRYFFPYLSIGLLTAVIFLSKFSFGNRYLIFISAISIFFASFQLANGPELVSSIVLSVFVFICLAVYKKQIAEFYESKKFKKVFLLALLIVSLFLIYLNYDYHRQEFNRYPLSFSKKESAQRDIGRGYKALNELTAKGARVAYTGRQEYYPLYGRGLKNRVVYVSVNEKEITPYNKPDGLYRKIKDFSAWRNNLKKQNIEYLFIAQPVFNNREDPDPSKFPVEDEWALAHPQDFQLVFNNSLSRIYKVTIK